MRSSLLHPAKPQLLYFRGSGGFGVLRRNLTALSRFERVHISLGEDYCPRCSASEVSYAYLATTPRVRSGAGRRESGSSFPVAADLPTRDATDALYVYM